MRHVVFDTSRQRWAANLPFMLLILLVWLSFMPGDL
jgi:hypothetical protein